MITDKEDYISIKPRNTSLQNYIAYYYFNISKVEGYQKEFIFYPHYRNAITVYKNARISFSGNTSSVAPNKNVDYEIIYTGVHLHSRIGKIVAPFDKIGVVFQSLGINNFLKEPFCNVITESPKSNFNYFGSEFNAALDEVYKTTTIEDKVDTLDTFFMANLNPFEEHRLINAVDLLLKEDISIQNLSERLSINRKTLLRLFRKHLNCSPKEFATLVKFRNALNLYQSQENKPQLTDLAYQNEYYDQSDFIKHFKKVTGFNPKKFFSNISHLGSEDTFWTLLEN